MHRATPAPARPPRRVVNATPTAYQVAAGAGFGVLAQRAADRLRMAPPAHLVRAWVEVQRDLAAVQAVAAEVRAAVHSELLTIYCFRAKDIDPQ